MRQTIRLNTPGKQDGGMALEVDGRRVIERGDVYYRGVRPPPPPPPTPTPPSPPSSSARVSSSKSTEKEKTSETASKAKPTTNGPPAGWSGGGGGKQDCGLLGLGCLRKRGGVFPPRREVAFDVGSNVNLEGTIQLTETKAMTSTMTRTVTVTQSVKPEVVTLGISEWETVAPNATTTTTATRTIRSTVTSTATSTVAAKGTYDAEEGDDGGDVVISEDDDDPEDNGDAHGDGDRDDESGVGFQGLFFRCALPPTFTSTLHLNEKLTLRFVDVVRSLEDTTRVTLPRRISIPGSKILG